MAVKPIPITNDPCPVRLLAEYPPELDLLLRHKTRPDTFNRSKAWDALRQAAELDGIEPTDGSECVRGERVGARVPILRYKRPLLLCGELAAVALHDAVVVATRPREQTASPSFESAASEKDALDRASLGADRDPDDMAIQPGEQPPGVALEWAASAKDVLDRAGLGADRDPDDVAARIAHAAAETLLREVLEHDVRNDLLDIESRQRSRSAATQPLTRLRMATDFRSQDQSHPAYMCEVVRIVVELRWRPRWVEGQTVTGSATS